MAERVLISFKETEFEKKLLEHLKEQSKLVGQSAFMKQLLYEDMQKKSPDKK